MYFFRLNEHHFIITDPYTLLTIVTRVNLCKGLLRVHKRFKHAHLALELIIVITEAVFLLTPTAPLTLFIAKS